MQVHKGESNKLSRWQSSAKTEAGRSSPLKRRPLLYSGSPLKWPKSILSSFQLMEKLGKVNPTLSKQLPTKSAATFVQAWQGTFGSQLRSQTCSCSGIKRESKFQVMGSWSVASVQYSCSHLCLAGSELLWGAYGISFHETLSMKTGLHFETTEC